MTFQQNWIPNLRELNSKFNRFGFENSNRIGFPEVDYGKIRILFYLLLVNVIWVQCGHTPREISVYMPDAKESKVEIAMQRVMATPTPQARPRAGCGTTTTAYTMVYTILAAAKVRNRMVASPTLGPVRMYSPDTNRNRGMFSISLRWALKNDNSNQR